MVGLLSVCRDARGGGWRRRRRLAVPAEKGCQLRPGERSSVPPWHRPGARRCSSTRSFSAASRRCGPGGRVGRSTCEGARRSLQVAAAELRGRGVPSHGSWSSASATTHSGSGAGAVTRLAKRFDGEARSLLRTLHRLGARQVVWVDSAPTHTGGPFHRTRSRAGPVLVVFPLRQRRLRGLDRRRDDLVLADWARRPTARPDLRHDPPQPNGAALMAKTIWERSAARPAPSGGRALAGCSASSAAAGATRESGRDRALPFRIAFGDRVLQRGKELRRVARQPPGRVDHVLEPRPPGQSL